MRRRIEVVERGVPERDVPARDWADLTNEPSFWRLVARGVVRPIAGPGGTGRLQGTGWVGRARFPEVDLEIVEKIPGALGALIAAGTPPSVRLVAGEAAVERSGALLERIADAFVDEARSYASSGLEFRYKNEPEVSALIAGRLDIRRTVRLRAQGRRHLLAFDRPSITQDTELNRIVLAALRQIEILGRVFDLPTGTIVAARGLAPLFSSARDPQTMLMRREAVAQRARTLADGPSANHVDLLRLAAALLAEQAFAVTSSPADDVPRSWFVNLADLFEQEARRALQDVAPSGTTVTASVGRPPIFAQPHDLFRANPDFLVTRTDSAIVTGDIKYKDWPPADEAGSLHSDLYQLLVHARAHETGVALMVFPSAAYRARHLVNATTGSDVLLVGLSVTDLRESARRALATALSLEEGRQAEARVARQAAADEQSDVVADAVQHHAVAALLANIVHADGQQLAATRRLLEQTIGALYGRLDEEVRMILLSAVHFGVLAHEENLDTSGPVLGLCACCEAVLKSAIRRGLGQKERAKVRKRTFGQLQKAIEGSDKQSEVVNRWLAAQSDELKRRAARAGAEMKALVDLRNGAAHSELLGREEWHRAFEAIVVTPNGPALLGRLTELADESALTPPPA